MSESPWEWLRRIQRRMEDEMERTMRMIKEAEMRTGCLMPLHHVMDTEDEYVITIDMPGADKEKIDLYADENRLIVEAPCRQDIPSARYGNRYRLMIELPTAIDTSNIKARYIQGVLEIRVSKKKTRGTKIKIE